MGLVGLEQSQVALDGELAWRSNFSTSRSQAPGFNPASGARGKAPSRRAVLRYNHHHELPGQSPLR